MMVLVCGGREFTDGAAVFALLDDLHHHNPISQILTGDVGGVDAAARAWAGARNVPCRVSPTDPNAGDPALGRRNQRVIDFGRPALVVAFPGGAGTTDLVLRAKTARITILNVDGTRVKRLQSSS